MLDKPTSAVPESRSAVGDVEALLGVKKGARNRFLRWRTLAWVVIAMAALAGGYVLWSRSGSGATLTYVTQPATRGSLTVIVTATGSAQPITQINISSELSGTVRKVNVDYNSVVKVGDVLAELDTDKLKATVESVRAKLEAVKARVIEASATIEEKRGQHERKIALAAKQAASVQDLDLAKAAYDRAVAQHANALAEVKIAQADLRLNEINLTKASIRSPINGVVLKRSVDPGQIVASSLQAPVLFVIAEDLRHMELQVDVDEADVGKTRIGHKANFSVDAYPDRKFPAVIRDIRFGSETVQGVVTYKAVLSIDNSELMIRPGMTATAEVVVQKVEDALTVPNAALRYAPATPGAKQGGGLLSMLLPRPPSASFRPPSKALETGPNRRLWVLRDGKPVAVPVVIGSTDGRRTEIVKGQLQADDAVILESSSPKR